MGKITERNGLRIESFGGEAARRFIPELSRLRVSVFHDFPYLYDGTLDYERNYLETYMRSPDSVVVVASDDGRAIGAATAVPLEHEPAYITAPFISAGYDLSKVFYCGESVLEPGYRGRGVGVAFFDHREAWARDLGRFERIAFCGVVRPENHPRRPKGYVPLDGFWRTRGYEKMGGLTCQFPWQDLDETEPSAKTMQFWMKRL